MSIKKRKIISAFFLMVGAFILLLVLYFLIQCLREKLYQHEYDERYEKISLQEEGVINEVQVFHGVKLNTYVKEEKKAEQIVFEIKDEVKEVMKGVEIHSDTSGMSSYNGLIHYQQVKDRQTGKEEFIVSVKKSSGNHRSVPTFRTYRINENGVVQVSNFDLDSKSKLETQWIKGISKEKPGYYTNLLYQEGATASILFLAVVGTLLLMMGLWLRRRLVQKANEITT